jgi:hypothetical protein
MRLGQQHDLVEVLREHGSGEKATARKVSLPVFSRSWRMGVGTTKTLPGPTAWVESSSR